MKILILFFMALPICAATIESADVVREYERILANREFNHTQVAEHINNLSSNFRTGAVILRSGDYWEAGQVIIKFTKLYSALHPDYSVMASCKAHELPVKYTDCSVIGVLPKVGSFHRYLVETMGDDAFRNTLLFSAAILGVIGTAARPRVFDIKGPHRKELARSLRLHYTRAMQVSAVIIGLSGALSGYIGANFDEESLPPTDDEFERMFSNYNFGKFEDVVENLRSELAVINSKYNDYINDHNFFL